FWSRHTFTGFETANRPPNQGPDLDETEQGPHGTRYLTGRGRTASDRGRPTATRAASEARPRRALGRRARTPRQGARRGRGGAQAPRDRMPSGAPASTPPSA